MKLLLDQNLSYRLLDRLQSLYPDSSQVRLLSMDRSDDRTIWQYARENSFTIVTKDSDFHELTLLYGAPPKIIWLKCGNTSTASTEKILIDNYTAIKTFVVATDITCLEIY